MPTTNPRVNVTLSPSLDSLVGQLAGHERVSKSTVLRELLEAAEPALRHAVALMEAASGAGPKARKSLVDGLGQGIKDAEANALQMLQYMAAQTRDMVAEAEAIVGRRPTRALAGAVASPQARAALPPAKVQAYADTNGVPPQSGGMGIRPPLSNRGVKSAETANSRHVPSRKSRVKS